MGLRGDERGQAVQVGAVLLLAVFVITLSLYQATVIPGENKQVEFNDYRDATADFADLRNAILRSAAQDAQSGVTVRTGSQYPARSLFVNPPPAAGRLSSSPAANVTISNVESAGDYENVRKYLTAEGNALNVSTRRLVFDPSYNELDVAPVAMAYGATYRDYDEPILTTEQTLVSGNRITLVSIAGNLSAGGYATPVTVEPVSAHTRTVSVTGDGGPLNLTVSTPLTAATWREQLLARQYDPGGTHPDRYVREVTPGPRPNTVNVSLEGGATYELRLARVEVHEESNAASEPTPAPRYVVSVDDREQTTRDDGRAKLVVEVRDQYSNPVANANVTFESAIRWFETYDGTNLTSNPVVRTNAEGRATVWFNATGKLGTIPVDAYLGDRTDSPPPSDASKTVQFTVFNTIVEGEGGGASGEQAGRGLLVLEDTATNATDNTFTFVINNTGEYPVNVTGYRLDYITKMAKSGQVTDGPNAITQVTFGGESRPGTPATVATEGKAPYFFGGTPIELSPGNRANMDVTFDASWNLGTKDALVISIAVYLEGNIVSTFTVFYINN